MNMAQFISEDQKSSILFSMLQKLENVDSVKQFEFILVNESHRLVRYRTALLWQHNTGISHVSGLSSIEANAPLIQWLNKVLADVSREIIAPLTLTQSLSGVEGEEQWSEWLAPIGLCIPIFDQSQKQVSSLLFLNKEESCSKEEVEVLQQWCVAWRNAKGFKAQATKFKSRGGLSKIKYALVLSAIFLALLFPVQLSVLAPAEVVPAEPSVIRASHSGVIDDIRVTPNQKVNKGDILITYNTNDLEHRLLVAERALEVMVASYRQESQQALNNQQSRSKITLIQGRINEKKVEVEHLRSELNRSKILAQKDGVVILDDPNYWPGRWVNTGEKIITVADPSNYEIQAWLSPSDLIPLNQEAKLTVHPVSNPLNVYSAKLEYLSFNALESPQGNYAYLIKASLDKHSKGKRLRIGQRTTLKITGERVTLFYWLFRRPLAFLRSWLGY